MVIISDASPIIALHNIGALNILKDVFEQVTITDIVRDEVDLDLPSWIVVDNQYDQTLYELVAQKLDRGEASSVTLCKEYPDSKLLIDERKGRAIATSMGIDIIGLLGLVVLAKSQGQIELGMPIITKLTENGFRISDKILSVIKSRLGE